MQPGQHIGIRVVLPPLSRIGAGADLPIWQGLAAARPPDGDQPMHASSCPPSALDSALITSMVLTWLRVDQ
jgi:hypothetical protein